LTSNEEEFRFGLRDQLKSYGVHGGANERGREREREQASTPDFSTFKTTSRRLLTPPSLSPSLLELHGRARRVSVEYKSGGNEEAEENDENKNDENTPVGAADDSKLAKFSLPRLDVAERDTNATKYPKLLSPTEQGIRDSLKLERTTKRSG
jgi:hypothetical protein